MMSNEASLEFADTLLIYGLLSIFFMFLSVAVAAGQNNTIGQYNETLFDWSHQ